MTELIWDGKYDKDGKRVAPFRVSLPFQNVETINETAQDRQQMLDIFSTGRDPAWRNRLIWGDKEYVLPSFLEEFAGKVNLIYIDPPFNVGADFSYANRYHPDVMFDRSSQDPHPLRRWLSTIGLLWTRIIDNRPVSWQWKVDSVLFFQAAKPVAL